MAKKKKGKALTNPNGANQYVLDPRQSLFLAFYLDPKSETFSNALQSALRAGYERSYAENILEKMPEWLREKVGKFKGLQMLDKAERNLDEILDLPSVVPAIGAFGPIVDKKTKKPVMKYSSELLKIKNDASQFIAERVGKAQYGKDDGDKTLILVQKNEIVIKKYDRSERKTGGE